jgi:fructose-1,6-bisphosphatase/inositol monophosphatase family enzyme
LKNAIGGTNLDLHHIIPECERIKGELIASVRKIRVFGACALELVLVAQGALDVYFDFRGITRIVDIAAGILIVHEAGGMTLDVKGTRILNHKMALDKRYGLIALNQALEKEIIEKITLNS